MSEQEAKLYEVVRKSVEELFTVKGYSVDFEITGHPRGKLIPKRFLMSEVLLRHRRKRLPTPDIMGLVWRKTRQDSPKLVIVEVKKRPNYRGIFQVKGYAELFNSNFTFLISQESLYTSSPKVLDFVIERPELIRTRNGNEIYVQFLHQIAGGKITVAQLGPEAGILPIASL